MTENNSKRKGTTAEVQYPRQPQNHGYSLRVLIAFFSFLAGMVILLLTGRLFIKIWLFTFFEALPTLAVFALLLLIVFPILVWKSFVLVPYNTIWVIQRLGKWPRVKKAGLRILIPFIDEMFSKEDLRRQEDLITANEAPTKKGATVNVTAILFWWFLPEDPARFILEVQNPRKYIIRTAEAAIRRLISSQSIEELQAIDQLDQIVLNDYLKPEVGDWAGFKLEISDIEFPPEIREALAEIEIAERNKEAEIIRSEAEVKVMENLVRAVRTYMPEDADERQILEKAMELRTLGTIRTSEGVLALADVAKMLGAKSTVVN